MTNDKRKMENEMTKWLLFEDFALHQNNAQLQNLKPALVDHWLALFGDDHQLH